MVVINNKNNWLGESQIRIDFKEKNASDKRTRKYKISLEKKKK